MIEVAEQGRRLRVLVGGEEEFIIPPQNARGGAALLSDFLGIMSDPLGGADHLVTDMVRVSLGAPVLEEGAVPTPQQIERLTEADALYDRMQELRQEEQYELTQAAFFWQTQGGITAARHIAEGGADAFPKALEALSRASGLEIFAAMTSTGSSSESETSPTGDPATSTPAPSGTLSKLPPNRRSRNQNQPPPTPGGP